LGSKQALSNGNEPEEVTDLVAAFEQHNKCKITLCCCLRLHTGYLDLEWTATAYQRVPGHPEVTGSALASAVVWGGGYKTLMGVHSRLLYALDFALAEHEFDKTVIK
jgi:hypothetical protein